MNVYLKAAKYIHDDTCIDDVYSCLTLKWINGEPSDRHMARVEKYAAMFKPYKSTSLESQWGDRWGKRRKECRVLALCFASAMHSTGDL